MSESWLVGAPWSSERPGSWSSVGWTVEAADHDDEPIRGLLGHGCFQGLVVSESVEDLGEAVGKAESAVRPRQDEQALPGLQLEDLRAALRDRDELLEQTSSQRNVARRELENLQRRWQQQVREYEQLLNAAHLECERLRRELDARPQAGENAVGVGPLEQASPPETNASPDRGGGGAAASGAKPEADLSRVFTRMRDRLRRGRAHAARTGGVGLGATVLGR